MSTATRMSSRRRISNYRDQTGSKKLTPRQRRRVDHKQWRPSAREHEAT